MNREKHFHPLAALHLLRKTLLVYLLPLVQVLFDRNWDALRAALRQDLVLLVFISAVCWAVYYGSRWQVDAEGTVHVSWRLGVRLDRALRTEGLAGTLFCISLVRSALQAVHYTVWRTDTQLGSRGGFIRRYEMRLRLSQLNYADLRRSPATWALHYCPVFVSAGACRPELPLFVWREGTPLLRELLPEMAQLSPDTRADTTDRSMVFFLPAGIPLALCLLLTAVSRTTLPALTLPLLIPTGVFAALLGAAAVGWHREGVWQQQGQLLLCRQHRFHLHQLCVFHPDTCFTALQSPWAVTVQRANLTLVFPGKEKVTVRSVPLAALDFLEI